MHVPKQHCLDLAGNPSEMMEQCNYESFSTWPEGVINISRVIT